MKIIFIGSLDIVAKSIIKFFNEKNSEVIAVYTFLDACDKVLVNEYDLIICNNTFSGGTAKDLLKHVKKNDALNKNSTFILLTNQKNNSQLFKISPRADFILYKNENLIQKLKELFDQDFHPVMAREYDVLVVDDDRFVQKTIQAWLKKYSNINLTFSSSIKDSEVKVEAQYDLIVSDYLLTDGDLYDFLSLYRRKCPNDQTPIIAYTGSINKIDYSLIPEDINFIAAFEKPFKVDKFLEILQNLN